MNLVYLCPQNGIRFGRTDGTSLIKPGKENSL